MSIGNKEVVNGLDVDGQNVASLGKLCQIGADTSFVPGNATSNTPAGISAIASGATTCTITNSLSTTSSLVNINWLGDTGATRFWVTRALGSFTVNLSSAAVDSVGFIWSVSELDKTLLPGLRRYWPLNGNSSDIFGVGNGIDVDVSYMAGKIGQCASFNGTTSKITTPASNVPLWALPRSMSLWLYKNSASNKIALGYGTAGSTTSLDILYFNNAICIYTYDAFGGAIPMSTGGWHHFVYTYNGTTFNTYLDGVAGTPWVKAINTGSSTPITIGSGVHPSFSYWDGRIDEVGLWDRCITLTEIADLYNSGSGRAHPF